MLRDKKLALLLMGIWVIYAILFLYYALIIISYIYQFSQAFLVFYHQSKDIFKDVINNQIIRGNI